MRFSIITFVAAFAGVVSAQAKVSQIPDGQVQAKTSVAVSTAKTTVAVSTAKTTVAVSTAKTTVAVSTAKTTSAVASKTSSAAPKTFTGAANHNHINAQQAALPFLAGVAYLLA